MTLHCFASPRWSQGFELSDAAGGIETALRTRAVVSTTETLGPQSQWGLGYTVTLLQPGWCSSCALGSWDVPQSPLQGVYIWVLGKSFCNPPVGLESSRAVRRLGTASRWVCILCCTPLLIVREEKSFLQHPVTLCACQPALWRGSGVCRVFPILPFFAHFAGCEEAMLSSGDSCGSL